MKNIQEYMELIFSYILIDKGEIFYPTNNPKISIIITVYNGEAFIKTALLSIQNQDFKNIEIIIIDDYSSDNSIKLIKELMKKEPRIVFYQNNENRGMFFTKTKGVLLAKGKYILLLDEDDIYVQRDAFSSLYKEAEKNNLDMLRFGLLFSPRKIKKSSYNQTKTDFPIIYQPKISEIMYKTNSNQVKFFGGLLTNYFIKRELFVKIIQQIDKKYFKNIMNFHDDYMLFFLLTRNAYNYKKIGRTFYIVITDWNKLKDKKVLFRIKRKKKNFKFRRCSALLDYIEFILEKTENSFKDKKIAVYSIDRYLLNYFCRNFSKIKDKAINISKKYLMNKYISEDAKKRIRIFLKEKNQIS